jgi:hypothetical protein
MRNFFLIFLTIFLVSFDEAKEQTFEPIERLIQSLNAEDYFEIVLHDMEEGDLFVDHKHRYLIIKEKDSTFTIDSNKTVTIKMPYVCRTKWYVISEKFYKKNSENLSMSLVTKNNKQDLNRTPSPTGYTQYINNKKYGSWKTITTDQTKEVKQWHFDEQYHIMNVMFHYLLPIYKTNYDNYLVKYYAKQAYYGTSNNGLSLYGTRSEVSQQRVKSGQTRCSSNLITRGSRYGNSYRSSGGSYGK